MLSLAAFNLPALAVALLIGIATGRWIFRGAARPTKPEDETSS
jgi:hypothetical protein